MNIKIFNSVASAGVFLRQELERELLEKINTHRLGIFMLPGGNSIKDFYPYLCQLNIPWKSVLVTLSDERCVPITSALSNERQLREEFLKYAPEAHFASITKKLIEKIKKNPPITILSMGTDGHIASLFPNEAQEWKNMGEGIFETKKQPIRRVTFTEKTLLLSKKIYVLIIGHEKEEFLRKNVNTNILSSVFRASCTTLLVS